MKVLFMGTPDFAAVSLRHLLKDGGFNIIGVVTQPDRPKGRGHKLAFSPVKEVALQAGLRIFQPEKISETFFIGQLNELAPDVIAVVAYGQKLPVQILEMPKFGCVNVHASLLPKYRGSSPIYRVIINGENETGITTMFMSEGWDEGDIIFQSRVAVGFYETVGELHDRLAEEGGKLLVKTLYALRDGKAPRISQDHEKASFAYKLKPEDSNIDWEKDAMQIYNQVRGLNPWPLAQTFFQGKVLKIWWVSMAENVKNGRPGEIVEVGKDYLKVACGRGFINIEQLQPENGKKMSAGDFIRGYHPAEGQIFGQ